MHSIGIFGFFLFYTFVSANVMFICWGGGQAPSPDSTPFVMTQINEIKRNRLPNFFYAFPMTEYR